MADQTITLPTGQKLDSSELVVAGQTVQRERDNIADPLDPAGIAKVKNVPPAPSEYGMAVRPIGHAPGDDSAAVLSALALLARVSDTVESYVDNTVRMLSLTGEGRLRVATASESDNFAPWGSLFGTYSAPAVGVLSPW